MAGSVKLEAPPGSTGARLKPQCLVAQTGSGSDRDTLWIGTDSPVLFRVGPTAQQGDVKAIDACPATHLAIGRLDQDPWPDLVLTDLKLTAADESHRSSSVTVLWGAADGMIEGRSDSLSIPNAISTAVGDLTPMAAATPLRGRPPG